MTGRPPHVDRWLLAVRLHETLSLAQMAKELGVKRRQAASLLQKGRALLAARNKKEESR